ncbi:DUF6624 domain-containing protein [Flavobacterium sp. Fl-318]|uniref:DUF6624 domain-containing protein n=2 Tax=Flavobacterium cupriresistens TaxID=2893885 RepID=A0ABU4RBD2_9FLAO|nr:DUF6624 domain-containing protein [Flavobacterium sp. Fl-318]
MKNIFTIIYFVFTFLLFTSCKTSRPYTEDMKIELKRMFDKDQELLTFDEKRYNDKKYMDSMNVEGEKVIRKNCEVAKKYFKKYSFPGLKENGKEAAMNFWLIVQHSDHDVVFQEKVLKAMKKEYKNKNISPRNYAYLYDRVAKNKGDKQLYATQIDWSSGKPLPLPLKYPEKVEELRKEKGLEPLKEYLDSFLNK